jgi:hypothetical protein
MIQRGHYENSCAHLYFFVHTKAVLICSDCSSCQGEHNEHTKYRMLKKLGIHITHKKLGIHITHNIC